jgi:hypothetical protein
MNTKWISYNKCWCGSRNLYLGVYCYKCDKIATDRRFAKYNTYFFGLISIKVEDISSLEFLQRYGSKEYRKVVGL